MCFMNDKFGGKTNIYHLGGGLEVNYVMLNRGKKPYTFIID